jgi:hypothetical protein
MDLIKNTKNAIEIEQKPSKINKAERYPSARNGLVAGSKPTERKMKSIARQGRLVLVTESPHSPRSAEDLHDGDAV